MDQNLKNRVLGQAYFLRGFYYFHLVNFYGRVPIILKYGDIYEPQATVAQGWAQVISDLKNAASLLPTSYTGLSPDGQVGRATQGAAMGYLGKAYLFNNKFDSASIQFKKVIDLGIYSLVPNYIDNSTLANPNNAESIYEIQFSTVTGTNPSWTGDPSPSWGHVNGRASTYGPNNFAFSDVKPTPFLLSEFHVEKTTTGQVDPRCMLTIFYNDTADTHRPTTPMYQTTFQAAYSGNSALFNDVYCKKYQNYLGDRPDDFDFKSAINERVMRYADILLMYAECLNELNQTAAAAPYIQQVRNRAQLPDLTATFAAMSQQQMRDQLSHERLLEFSLEGHRFDDIHRWRWLQDPTKLALLKSRDPEFNTYVPGREYLPIPEQEISTNVHYTQNPGY